MFLRCMAMEVIIRFEGGLFTNFLFRKLMQMFVVDAVGCPHICIQCGGASLQFSGNLLLMPLLRCRQQIAAT